MKNKPVFDLTMRRQPAKSHQCYVLGLLLAIYTINFVDRQLIAVASPLLKDELGVSDTQLGFLKGFAFAALYGIAGIPIARLGDRSSRVNIISISLAFWSTMTALTGVANTYLHLLLTRIGLGLGEAGCTPSAHSLLSNYFPANRLHTVLSIYSLGIPLGNMMVFLIGGLLMEEAGWRMAFIAFGGIGLMLAVLFKSAVKEPVRHREADNESRQNIPDFWRSVSLMLKIPSYRALCVGAGFAVFGAFGLVNWILDFFVRNYQLSIGEIGTPLAFIYGFGGSSGMLISGYLSDRLGQKNKSAYLIVPGLALVLGSLFVMAAIWSSTIYLSYVFLGFAVLFIHFYQGPMYALAQMLAPTQLKAQSAAFIIFIQVFFGIGAGPFVVGGLSDVLAPYLGSTSSLTASMSLLSVSLLLAGFVLIKSAKNIAGDLYST